MEADAGDRRKPLKVGGFPVSGIHPYPYISPGISLSWCGLKKRNLDKENGFLMPALINGSGAQNFHKT